MAMSQERRPRYEYFADKNLRQPRHPVSRSPSPAYSTSSSEYSSAASSAKDTASSHTTDFDDLYDVSDDDSAVVPIKVSNSIKQVLSRNDFRRESLPSLVIPSPSAWPTVQKAGPTKADDIPPVPSKLPLSPQALERLQMASLRVPNVNSTPSLDGSLSSDEAASISPSTPELQARAQEVNWEMPMQLTQQAMDTLQHLSPDFPPDEQELVIEVPQTQSNEMQERGLNINLVPPQQSPPQSKQIKRTSSSEPVSAISVPSPGGFFASLDNTSKRTWSWSQYMPQQPTTTTAECFYDVPWDHHIDQVKERVVEITNESDSDGPPTARQENFTSGHRRSAGSREMVLRGDRDYEYDEEYERKLHETAASNASRTSLWLAAQDQYLSALKGSNPLNELTSPVNSTSRPPWLSPDEFSSTGGKDVFSSEKKAVRFVDPQPSAKAKTPLTAIRAQIVAQAQSDPLFYFAFQHMHAHARDIDAHKLRQLRADALQAQRAHMRAAHHAQLLAKYAIALPAKPEKDFGHLPSAPNDPSLQKQREEVARIDRERKALQQISLACWQLEAAKFLAGGCLLPRAASDVLSSVRAAGRTPRVLDLGGLPTADWGWAIALEHRDAKVYTAIVEPLKDESLKEETSDDEEEGNHWSRHRCPSNYRALTISTPYSLPFPAGSFDVVSARTLHALCRNAKATETNSPTFKSPSSAGAFDDFNFPFASDFSGANRGALPDPPTKKAQHYNDEFAATLAEIRRVLAPGGVLAYEFMDAEVAPTSRPRKDSGVSVEGSKKTKSLHARSVEFAVALKQQQFDPCAGHRSIPRLTEAGFRREDIKESWVELPVGGDEDGVGAISEVAGGVKWERWCLSTRGERGLKGVPEAMEEARKGGKGEGVCWRMCMGVAKNW